MLLKVMEKFFVHLKVALFGGILLAAPVVIYQLWRFVDPAFYDHERRLALPFVLSSTLLFAGGVSFCYFVMLPFAFNFLIGYSLDPGAGLTGEARLATVTPASAAVTAAGVLGLARADGGRPGAPRGAAPAQAAEGLVLVAASADPGGLAERVADLVRSLEAPRLATRTVEVRQGALRATFPVAEGETARLFVGTERSLLTGYRTEIAPNTWMPVPQVEVALDGLALQGRLSSGGLDVEAWSSETLEVRRQERRDAKVGALQLPERRVRAARARVEDGAGELLAADGERPALGVSVREP
jgi:hypothetical protein